MTLEQWELDLRRQLEGKNSNPFKTPKKTAETRDQSWEDDLMEEIQDLPPQSPQPKTNNTALFAVVLVFLGLITLFMYNYKSNGVVWNWIQSKFQSSPTAQEQQQPSPVTPQSKDYANDIKLLREDLKKLESQQKDDLAKINDKLKTHHDKITLMGMAFNENFLIVYNNGNRSHLIFFNRDWTIDRMPQYLELTEQDREYLNKFIKSP